MLWITAIPKTPLAIHTSISLRTSVPKEKHANALYKIIIVCS